MDEQQGFDVFDATATGDGDQDHGTFQRELSVPSSGQVWRGGGGARIIGLVWPEFIKRTIGGGSILRAHSMKTNNQINFTQLSFN